MGKKPVSIKCQRCCGEGKIVQIEWESNVPFVRYSTFNPERQIEVRKNCDKCKGKGWTGSYTNPSQCSKCTGEGHIYQYERRKMRKYHDYTIHECSLCNGSGYEVRMVEE